jgi:hypothetical protein
MCGTAFSRAWLRSSWREAELVSRVALCTADKAAVVVAASLGWLDSLVSLEALAGRSGVTRGQVEHLARQYTAAWLDEVRVKIRLGVIP